MANVGGTTKHGGRFTYSGPPPSEPGEGGRASSVVEGAVTPKTKRPEPEVVDEGSVRRGAAPTVKLGASVAEQRKAIERGYAVYKEELPGGRERLVGGKPIPKEEPTVKKIFLGASEAEHESATRRGYVVVEQDLGKGRTSYVGYAPSEYQKVQREWAAQEELKVQRGKAVAAGRTELESVEKIITPSLEKEYEVELKRIEQQRLKTKFRDEPYDPWAEQLQAKSIVLQQRLPIYEAYQRERVGGRVDVPEYISTYEKEIEQYNKDIQAYNRRLGFHTQRAMDIRLEKLGYFTETTTERILAPKPKPRTPMEKLEAVTEKAWKVVSAPGQWFEQKAADVAWAGTKVIYPKTAAQIEAHPQGVEAAKAFAVGEAKKETRFAEAGARGVGKAIVFAPVTTAASFVFTAKHFPTGAKLLVTQPKQFAGALGVGAGVAATSISKLTAEELVEMEAGFLANLIIYTGATKVAGRIIKGKPKVKKLEHRATTKFDVTKVDDPIETIEYRIHGKQRRYLKVLSEGTGYHDVETTAWVKPRRFSWKLHPKKGIIETEALKPYRVQQQITSRVSSEFRYPVGTKFTGKIDDLYLPYVSKSAYTAEGIYLRPGAGLLKAPKIADDIVGRVKPIKGDVWSAGREGRSYTVQLSETKVGKEPTRILGRDIGEISPVLKKIDDQWYVTEQRVGKGYTYLGVKKRIRERIPYTLDDVYYGKAKVKEAPPTYVPIGGAKQVTKQKPLTPVPETTLEKILTSKEYTQPIVKEAEASFYTAPTPVTPSQLKQATTFGAITTIKPTYKQRVDVGTMIKPMKELRITPKHELMLKPKQILKPKQKTKPIQELKVKPTYKVKTGQIPAFGIGTLPKQARALKLKPLQQVKLKPIEKVKIGFPLPGITPITPPPPPPPWIPPDLPRGKKKKKRKREPWEAYNIRVNPIPTIKQVKKIIEGV